MKIVQGILLTIVAIVLSGFAAAASAIALAETGILGSCFEGACGYRAIYAAFPLLWILFSIGSIAGIIAWRRRRA